MNLRQIVRGKYASHASPRMSLGVLDAARITLGDPFSVRFLQVKVLFFAFKIVWMAGTKGLQELV